MNIARNKKEASSSEERTPLHEFLRDADKEAVSARFAAEARELMEGFNGRVDRYAVVTLLDTYASIDDTDLDEIFSALQEQNPQRNKDVLLLLVSNGGSIESAYQISKICRSMAAEKFVVAIPRQAKSAATLIAIGADEIHMGPLAQLGPIDPQLGGLPALSVSRALGMIASIADRYPKSGEMFAGYLKSALAVEQIGYCERISDSACQYAERLLANKGCVGQGAEEIATELVYGYKDHGFVIDPDEARNLLGSTWVRTSTPEVELAEELYDLFYSFNRYLRPYQSQQILVTGGLSTRDVLVIDLGDPAASDGTGDGAAD